MCRPNKHNYKPIDGAAYFKRYKDERNTGIGLPEADQSIAYRMLYCTKCGDVKEVIAHDHRGK